MLLLHLHLQHLHHHLHILILTLNRLLERVEVALDKVGFLGVVLFGFCSCLGMSAFTVRVAVAVARFYVSSSALERERNGWTIDAGGSKSVPKLPHAFHAIVFGC